MQSEITLMWDSEKPALHIIHDTGGDLDDKASRCLTAAVSLLEDKPMSKAEALQRLILTLISELEKAPQA